MIKQLITYSLLVGNCYAGAGLVSGTLSPINNTNGSGGGSGGALVVDGVTIISNASGVISAQGFTNVANGFNTLLYTNIGTIPSLYMPQTPAALSNINVNSYLGVVSTTSSRTANGLWMFLFGTNFVTGQAMSTNINPYTLLAETNYLQNNGNPAQISVNGLQDTNNIGRGALILWGANLPVETGGFVNGFEFASQVYTNGVTYFNVAQSSNYDGPSDGFAKAMARFDGNQAVIQFTNLSRLFSSATRTDFGFTGLTNSIFFNGNLLNYPGDWSFIDGNNISHNSTIEASNYIADLRNGTTSFDTGGNGTGIGYDSGNMAIFASGTKIARATSSFGFEMQSAENLYFKGGTTRGSIGDTSNGENPANIYAANLIQGSNSTFLSANITNSLVMGTSTNTPSFTIVQTNFIDGGLNTNQTGRTILVTAPCKLTTTGVSGNASYSLLIPGSVTNTFGISTIVTSIAMSYTNAISGFVPAGVVYTFTNTSTGAGDSAAILNGGQYMVY